MINTISYFSLDSFEGVKPATTEPSEFAIASGFAALMNLPAPVATPIKAISPEDPIEISAFSTIDPEAGGGEGQTGKFFPDQSPEATDILTTDHPAAPTVSTPGGFCYDGTPWHPILKKDYGLDIISNRRQITDTPVNPVRLPPIENPSSEPPRDSAKKDDFGIQMISGGRQIVDPTVVPVRLPPIEPAATTKPDVKSTSVKPSYNPGVQNLPANDALWGDDTTRDPDAKKDFNLGVFTSKRPITDTTAIPVKLPPRENLPSSGTFDDPVKANDPAVQTISDRGPVSDPAVNPVMLPPLDPVSTTKTDVKSAPIKTSPGSNAPIKLPPHDALWDDGSTRDPKEMKKFSLGIFNRIRSITSTQPTAYQVVPAALSGPVDSEKVDGAIRANKWLDSNPVQKAVQPAVDVEPDKPATIGEFHLPEDFETGQGAPASLPETAPDQAIKVTPGAEAKVEETPLLVRPRPVIDPASVPVKLPSEEPVSNTTKPGIKYGPIDTSSSPSVPVKLPPRQGLWDDGTTRDTTDMKKFNLGIFNRQRPVTDPKASLASDLSEVATVQAKPADAEATVAAIRANKWLEQLTGQKLPQPVVKSPPKVADDIEPGPPVMLDESQLPAGNPNIKTVPAAEPIMSEKPLLVRPRPITDPAAAVEKPLLRQPFQPVQPNGTANGEKDDHRANLSQLFREVSDSMESGGHGTLKSVVAGTEDIINEIAGHGTLKSVVAGTADIINEIGGYLTEVEIAPETGIKSDALDPMDLQFEKLWQPEQVANKDVIKTDAGTLTLQDAKEILDQVKPGLLELAAFAAKKNEKQSMKMRLHPAELGAVEISLERNSSGALSAHFRTENEGARQALTNNLEQLRDSLQKSGWQVGQLEVSSNPSSSTADQNREHRSRQNEVAGDPTFDHRSEKQEDLEQDPSSRLLNLRA